MNPCKKQLHGWSNITLTRMLLLVLCADCVQNSDQKATCTWNEPVDPGDDKLVQFRVTANKTGTYQNKATVLTTMPGVVNQTATAPVTIVPKVRCSSSARTAGCCAMA
jgi:hypothetical protein